MVRGTENNDSQQESMTRDDSVSSQADSHILLVGKSEIGNPYSKLDDLNNILGSKQAETNDFPAPLLQLVGAPLDQCKLI